MRKLIATALCSLIFIGGNACSNQVAPVDCARVIEEVIDAEGAAFDLGPGQRVFLAMERQVPTSCRDSKEYLAVKAFSALLSGRVNEAEQLVERLDWRNTDQFLVLSAAAYLIIDHRRLDGSLDTAETLARKYIRLSPESIRAWHLLGEVMMEKDQVSDVVNALDEMKALRRKLGLIELHDADVDYIPFLSEMDRHQDALTIFRAAEDSFPVWEREDLIFSALVAASELEEDSTLEQLISETRLRRPDVAAGEGFKRIAQSFERIRALDASEPAPEEI